MKKQLTVAVLLVICGCAIRENPHGGPEDTKPPEIIYTFPQSDSTGIHSISEIEITFSERMNKTSVENALFISPPISYDIDWSGWDELTLELTEELSPNQTYVITLASSAEDLNRNRLHESYQFAFSTGLILNEGRIPGKIMGYKQSDLLYIYAYTINNPDSLNPMVTKADFLTMPDDKGNFQIKYLAFDRFRIFIVEDINRNFLLDGSIERVGIPWRDVALDSVAPEAPFLTFSLTKIDTTPPVLIDMRSTNSRTILMRFSEPVIKLTPNMFTIKDTLTGNLLGFRGYYRDTENSNQYILLTDTQDSTAAFKVVIEGIADSSGNVQTKRQSYSFLSSIEKDTTKFILESVSPADSLSKVSLVTPVTLNFSLPVDTMSVIRSVHFISPAADSQNSEWKWGDLKKGNLSFGKQLIPGSTYGYTVSLDGIRSIWGDRLKDSTFTNTFFTISEDEFGSISGKYLGDPDTNVYIQSIPLTSKQGLSITKVKKDGNYRLKWLPEGKYKIGGYLDRNNDGRYSKGHLIPFDFAEPYYLMDDTIRVKKRWEKTGVNFGIPGVE